MHVLDLFKCTSARRLGMPVLVLAAVLISACSGGGMLAEGGWVFEGDDVIVVQSGASSTADALDRAVRTFRRYDFRMNVVDRRAGYARTAPLAFNDTLEIRLNAVVTDSMLVEIAGEISGRSETMERQKWSRIAWQQHISRGDTPWALMVDVAGAIGSVSSYHEDPNFDAVPCGGRRCPAEEVCDEYVCRAE